MDQRPIRANTIKLLEENIEGKLHDIGFGNDFLDMIPKAQARKYRQTDLLENLKIYATKFPINRAKRKPTEWEKTFANHISDKELVSRIYGELPKLNNNNNNNNKNLTQFKNGQRT